MAHILLQCAAMLIRKKSVAAILLVPLLSLGALLLAPMARAATLQTAVVGNWERAPAIVCPTEDPLCAFTPPPRIASGSVACMAANVGSRAQEVTLSIFSTRSGAVALQKTCPGLAPGATCATDPKVAFAPAGYSCRIDFPASKSTVRASLSVSTPDSIRSLTAR